MRIPATVESPSGLSAVLECRSKDTGHGFYFISSNPLALFAKAMYNVNRKWRNCE